MPRPDWIEQFYEMEYMDSQTRQAMNYLIKRDLSAHERLPLVAGFERLLKELGPVVKSYPSWHPLVARSKRTMSGNPPTIPNSTTGYEGLDHTVYFAHGFITCPYQDAEKVIASSEARYDDSEAYIEAEQIDLPFYSKSCQCVVVRCVWTKLNDDMTVPSSIAVPLMMEAELPQWRKASVAEDFTTMRPYLYGAPNTAKGSAFVDKKTTTLIRDIYKSMVMSGMYGPERD